MKKSLKINFFLVTISLYVLYLFLSWIYHSEMSKARDIFIFWEFTKIKNNLKGKLNYNFVDISSYNKYFNSNIKLSDKCYYFKSTNNNFIFISKLTNIDFIHLYWEYFIYKSDDNYIINNEEIEIFKNMIKKDCTNYNK